ncbi:neuronal growth regulator 1 [Aplysia californica]|uniref:Neuronal growth regulator 1 n=1 Tax=Aplysia californica TaxID=6500 RepID=A0ABM0JD42_APLCA|nr:neuronal growth regulator 1 [Aplysia californica]
MNRFILSAVLLVVMVCHATSQSLTPQQSTVTIQYMEGDTAILPCSLSREGRYSLVWADHWFTVLTFNAYCLVDDQRISVVRSHLGEWNLKIENVTRADQGLYTCQTSTTPISSQSVMLYVVLREDNPSVLI